MSLPTRVYTLVKRAPDARGLVCDGEGVMLGPVPLVVPILDATGRTVFRVARPEWIADVLATAYGSEFDPALAHRIARLEAIAKAVGEGNLAEAAIRAVHLQLPDLTAEAVGRLARLRKMNPNHQPAGQPNGGQFAPKDGGQSGESSVKRAAQNADPAMNGLTVVLPDGSRIPDPNSPTGYLMSPGGGGGAANRRGLQIDATESRLG